MTINDIALYYDELHRWTKDDKSFQAFSGLANDTIHRFLIDADTGSFSPDTVYKFIDPYMPPHGVAAGLDAGCGYGGTCFRYQQVHGGHWTGITISREQWAYANTIAQARGLQNSVGFRLMSYDAALPGRFNVIVAIESLIHSADPAATLRNLVASLDAGGRLIIVDDMPVHRMRESDAAVFADFKRAWRCPVALSAEAWRDLAQTAGLRPIAEQDLSHLQKPRSETDLDAALTALDGQRAEKSQQGFARLSDAEIGGIHLERLLGRGAIRYMTLAFEQRG